MVTTSQRLFKKYPKSAAPFRIIMFIRVFFGIYFNYHSSKIISTLLRLYCLGVAIGFYIENIMGPHFIFTHTASIIEYNLYVLFHLYTANEYFFEYCNNLKIQDSIIGFKNTKLVTSEVIAAIVIVFITRIVLFFIYMFYIHMQIVPVLITGFILSSLSCSYLSQIIIFGLLRNRMVLLRKSLETCEVPVNIINKRETAKKIKQLRKNLYYYNYLLENINNADKYLQYMLTISLAVNFPKVVQFVYVTIMGYIRKIDMSLPQVALVIDLIQIILLISLPALICELINNEVDKIRDILQQQLLRCSDEPLHFELETALDYVTRRPFRFNICRVLSLDLSLLVAFFSTCITYVIVLMQFTLVPS